MTGETGNLDERLNRSCATTITKCPSFEIQSALLCLYIYIYIYIYIERERERIILSVPNFALSV